MTNKDERYSPSDPHYTREGMARRLQKQRLQGRVEAASREAESLANNDNDQHEKNLKKEKELLRHLGMLSPKNKGNR